METFSEAYCRENRCKPNDFGAALFWRTLYIPALPIATLLGGRRCRHFAPDRALLANVATARSMADIREAIRDHYMDPANRRLLRRYGHVRISTRKLKRLARSYVPER